MEMFNRIDNDNLDHEKIHGCITIYTNYIKPVIQQNTTLLVCCGRQVTHKRSSNKGKSTTEIRVKLLTITLLHKITYTKLVAVNIISRELYD